MAEDDGENVVEIVRDAAGKLADGLHFLRLAELLLQLFVASDIPEQAQKQARLAAGGDVGIGDLKHHAAIVVQHKFALALVLHQARAKQFPVPLQKTFPIRPRGINQGE